MQEIKQRLSEEIINSKYSQTKLAKLISVKQPTVNDYIKMKKLPALDTLAKLYIILDVSADYILGIEDYSGKKKEQM